MARWGKITALHCWWIKALHCKNRLGILLSGGGVYRRDGHPSILQARRVLRREAAPQRPSRLLWPLFPPPCWKSESAQRNCLQCLCRYIYRKPEWRSDTVHMNTLSKFYFSIPGEKWQIQANGFVPSSHWRENMLLKIWQPLSLYCYGLSNLD